jgi:hypothetical protein
MASTLNAVIGGVTLSSDTSGALDIQTGGVNAISIGTGQTVTISNAALTNFSATSANITTLTSSSGTITNLFDGVGNVRNIPSAGSEKTTAYTLTISDIGEFVTVGTSGSITVVNDVFSAGNAVSIYNNTSGNVTLTMSITTAYIAGTDSDKATMTLATRGLATLLFLSASAVVVTGNVT